MKHFSRFVIIAAALTIVAPAFAQNNTTKRAPPHREASLPSGTISKEAATQNPVAVLQAFTVSDLQAALADAQAQTPPDTISIQCYQALIPLVQSNIANPLPTSAGGFQLLQKARDAKSALANIQSPTGPLAQLNIACAPLVLDVQNTLIQLGIVGGAVAVAGPAGGLTLPTFLPALTLFH